MPSGVEPSDVRLSVAAPWVSKLIKTVTANKVKVEGKMKDCGCHDKKKH